MNTRTLVPAFGAALAAALAPAAFAQTITNGGFESGFTGWTRADQTGSDGQWSLQTGTATPINGFVVPAPPQGAGAAMTDAAAGGSHVLYQDFTVPAVVTPTAIQFSLYLNNGGGAYFVPNTLDWAATNQTGGLNLNQQARVDIITTTGDVFSLAAASVLQNLFATTDQTPLVLGYTTFSIDITTLLQAHAGETLRLRFAETDNVNFFNMGVDNVSFGPVPAPSAGMVMLSAVAALARRRRSR
ncbi:MAG: hypothetical protein ACREJO_02925 [Phycisphaerales bacterium]